MSADRPQYGEYATPEEQRARAGLPPIGADAAASAPVIAPPTAPAVPADVAASAEPVGARTPAGPLNRLMTIMLLALGLINVLTSIPGFVDLASTLNLSLQMLGIEGEFSNFAAARTWGVVSVLVMLVGYLATAWFSFRLLKRGRAAWWVPLVGAVVTMLVVSICVSVPMIGDPAFTQSLLTPPAG